MAMTLRLPTGTARRLRVTGALTGRSANEIVTEAVEQWLDRNQPENAARLITEHDGRSGSVKDD